MPGAALPSQCLPPWHPKYRISTFFYALFKIILLCVDLTFLECHSEGHVLFLDVFVYLLISKM